MSGVPLIAMLMAAWLCGGAVAAHAAVKTMVVEYKQGDTVLEGFLAYDDAMQGKRPGVLVVHEWGGLEDYTRMRAQMLAKLGYVAFAADIYGKGVRPATPQARGQEAGKYRRNRSLLRERALAGLAQLKSNAMVDASRVAAIGYCFGGTTVLELARSGAEVNGVVSFHGDLSNPNPQDVRNIKAKVLVLHGANDPIVPQKDIETFQKEMLDAKVDLQFVSYSNTVHSFTNPKANAPQIGAQYNPVSDRRSWRAMQEFFSELLKR